MNEDMIERCVERMTDKVDAKYMAGELTTKQYAKRCAVITRWANMSYRKMKQRRAVKQ